MDEEHEVLNDFVGSYLDAVGADVHEEADGILAVAFPSGRKRAFGRERRIAFDEAHRADHVEVMEPGSPLLKQFVEDAIANFGGVGVVHDEGRPDGTTVFSFRLTLYTALKKRVRFLTATTGPGYDEPFVREGLPDFVFGKAPAGDPAAYDHETVREALDAVQPAVRKAAEEFARPGVEEASKLYRKNAQRVTDYYRHLREEAFRQEARLRKRLGEIQSKLYFTEDGLREIKLEKERDRITRKLREMKQQNTEQEQELEQQEQEHLQRQRRRYEPKLSVHLVGVTVLTERAGKGP